MPVTELRLQQDRVNLDATRFLLPTLLRVAGGLGDNPNLGPLASLLFPRMSAFRSAASAIAFTAARAIASDVPRFGVPPYRVEWLASSLADTLPKLPGESAALGAARAAARLVRHVEQAGRDTTMRAAIEAPSADGWARVSAGSACGFCLTMLSRGVVFATERTATFRAHDHDRCIATLVRKGQTDWPGAQEAADAEQTYADVTRGLKGREALQAMNRHVYAQENSSS